jgi:hypothetical protein
MELNFGVYMSVLVTKYKSCYHGILLSLPKSEVISFKSQLQTQKPIKLVETEGDFHRSLPSVK